MKRLIITPVLALVFVFDLSAQWAVSTWAGTGTAGHLDSALLQSLFDKPWGMVADTAGNIYLSDNSNNCIRKIDVGTGIVMTLTGEPGVPGFADGPPGLSRLGEVTDLAIAPDGLIWFSDFTNHAIRTVDAAGTVTTITGTGQGYSDGSLNVSQFRFPRGLAIDRSGLVYVGDSWNHRIRRIDVVNGTVSTFAGGGTAMGVGSMGDYVDAQDTAARFWTPCGLAVNGGDSIFVADAFNHRIRIIAPDGRVTTLVGRGGSGSGAGGYMDGSMSLALFNTPTEVLLTGQGSQYLVSDTYNHCLRWVDPASDTVWTLAGTGTLGNADGAANVATFNQPRVMLPLRPDEFLVADFNNNKLRLVAQGTGAIFPSRSLQNENLLAGPVPLQDELSINWTGSQPVMLRLLDSRGAQVVPAIRIGAKGSAGWNVASLPCGMYLLTAEDGRGIVAVKKVVKD